MRHEPVSLSLDVDSDALLDLIALRQALVFLGHHSIGRDILDGLWDLASALGVEAAISHAPIGENGDPLGKIDDFEARALASGADIVAMKLCFADFHPHSEVDRLLGAYRRTVLRLKSAGLRVLHVTAPLHARQTDPASRLKRMLQRPVWEDHANLKRLEYNEKLCAAVAGEPLFDLADAQSTRPDGTKELHPVRARLVPMLWPGWTRDGAHLNEPGKRMAARKFVRAVADALS